MELGAERYSRPLADAVASCAPRPSELQPAAEVAVSAAAAGLCVKSLRRFFKFVRDEPFLIDGGLYCDTALRIRQNVRSGERVF